MAYRGESIGRGTEEIDYQNRQNTEQLSHKISHLKGIAHEIEIETKEHNRLLDEMDTDFDSSDHLLSGSLRKVNLMLKGGRANRQLMCYVSLAIVGVFILGYYIVHKVTS